MTLRQVAARSGYSPAALSMAESGRRLPSWEVLAAFVQSCDADPAQWRPLWQSAAESGADPVPGTRQRPEMVPGDDAGAGSANGAGPQRPLRRSGSRVMVTFAACGLIAVALWAAVSHLTTPGPKPRPATHGAPAVVHFVVAPESCGPLRFGADGTASPVTCPGGRRPSLAADRYYRRMRLRVLGLGSWADPGQVRAAICADLGTGKITFPIETGAVELAQAEQAWHFGVTPVSDVGPGLCPRARG